MSFDAVAYVMGKKGCGYAAGHDVVSYLVGRASGGSTPTQTLEELGWTVAAPMKLVGNTIINDSKQGQITLIPPTGSGIDPRNKTVRIAVSAIGFSSTYLVLPVGSSTPESRNGYFKVDNGSGKFYCSDNTGTWSDVLTFKGVSWTNGFLFRNYNNLSGDWVYQNSTVTFTGIEINGEVVFGKIK